MFMILIWFFLAFLLAIGELVIPGTLFLLGFSSACLSASVLAWFDYSLARQLSIALIISFVSFILIWIKFSSSHTKNNSNYKQSLDAIIGIRTTMHTALAYQRAGYVTINGQQWLVRWSELHHCHVNQEIVVIGIKGCHLVIKPFI